MKVSTLLISRWLFAFVVAGSGAVAAQSQSLTEALEGPPVLMGTSLAPVNYIKIVVQKLKHPVSVYVNRSWLIENGYSPEGAADILVQKLAYAKPMATEDPSLFLSDHLILYPDRYGDFSGEANGTHIGSGRAASIGRVQVKGLGSTELLGDGTAGDHANGGMSLRVAIKEAIWSQIAENELPYGANRVIAVIDTGTEGHILGRALMIREDRLRPAHFEEAKTGVNSKYMPTELERVRLNTARLPFVLPQAVGTPSTSPSVLMASGLEEVFRRVARQYAAMYARKIYHGSFSSSNLGLFGETLDLSEFTAQGGFAKIRYNYSGAFGLDEVNEIQRFLVDYWMSSIRANAPKELLSRIKSPEYYKKFLLDEYQTARRLELLRLAGVPDHLIARLGNTAQGAELARAIDSLAAHGAPDLNFNESPNLQSQGTYQLEKILPTATKANSLAEGELEVALRGGIPNREERIEFVKVYRAFMLRVQAAAGIEGVSAENLKKYLILQSERMTAQQPELFRDQLDSDIVAAIQSQKDNPGQPMIQQFIQNRIAQNRRTFRDGAPYEFVVSEKTVDEKSGLLTRTVFNARRGRYEIRSLLPKEPQHAWELEPANELSSVPSCRAIFGT